MTLELYPTLLCNLSCRFCDTTLRHARPTGELSAARLLEILDEAAAMGVKRLFLLGGGEPLLRKDATPALMKRAKAHGMEGILTTNGTFLGPELARTLIEIGWDEVHVSIDGADAATHDDLRGQQGAFQRTVRNLCRLSTWRRQQGVETPRLALHTVVTARNWRAMIDILHLARAMGATRVDFDALVAYASEQLALAVPPEEVPEVARLAREGLAVAAELGIATTLGSFLSPQTLERGQTRVEAPDLAGLAGAPCLKAWHHLVIQADGRTSPCCVLAGEGGSAAEAPLSRVWATDPFLGTVRAGMLAHRPLPRCSECSQNILRHEAVIRSHLPQVGANA